MIGVAPTLDGAFGDAPVEFTDENGRLLSSYEQRRRAQEGALKAEGWCIVEKLPAPDKNSSPRGQRPNRPRKALDFAPALPIGGS